MPKDSRHTEARFLLISTDSLCLQVAETPRSQDVATFMTDKNDHFTPCACAQSNYQNHRKVNCYWVSNVHEYMVYRLSVSVMISGYEQLK